MAGNDVTAKNVKAFVTWERLALTLLSLLIMVVFHASSSMQVTLEKLNSTLVEMKVEFTRGQERTAALIRRVNRIERKIDGRHP